MASHKHDLAAHDMQCIVSALLSSRVQCFCSNAAQKYGPSCSSQHSAESAMLQLPLVAYTSGKVLLYMHCDIQGLIRQVLW